MTSDKMVLFNYRKRRALPLPTEKMQFSKPLMAVLVNGQSGTNLQNQRPPRWIRLLAQANMEVKNTLYFFPLRNVNLKEGTIRGYLWHPSRKKWLQRSFSFPDILYIKCRIDKQYLRTFTALCTAVTKNQGRLITHQPFDKWRLYRVLRNDPETKNYLPATRTCKQPEDIKKMLRHYRVVYLKSHFGRKGEHVLRVEVLPGRAYRYSYYRDEQLTVKTVADFSSLLTEVNTFFQGKQFLVQQGIRLIKNKNKIIDMRAEMQHNGSGGLDIVGISVRYGKTGSPVATHGDAYAFEDFFIHHMGYSKEQIEALRNSVQQFLFSIYKYLENNYGEYPEMGIDFALDTNNRLWFIEANSQSTKVSLEKAYGKEALYRHAKNTLDYARYLFQQSRKT